MNFTQLCQCQSMRVYLLLLYYCLSVFVYCLLSPHPPSSGSSTCPQPTSPGTCVRTFAGNHFWNWCTLSWPPLVQCHWWRRLETNWKQNDKQTISTSHFTSQDLKNRSAYYQKLLKGSSQFLFTNAFTHCQPAAPHWSILSIQNCSHHNFFQWDFLCFILRQHLQESCPFWFLISPVFYYQATCHPLGTYITQLLMSMSMSILKMWVLKLSSRLNNKHYQSMKQIHYCNVKRLENWVLHTNRKGHLVASIAVKPGQLSWIMWRKRKIPNGCSMSHCWFSMPPTEIHDHEVDIHWIVIDLDTNEPSSKAQFKPSTTAPKLKLIFLVDTGQALAVLRERKVLWHFFESFL